MNRKLVAFLIPALAVGLLYAQVPAVKPILPSALSWTSPPTIPGARVAWVLGAEKESGPYLQRVELRRGARVPPHTHPDLRYSTVLSGTLYVGFGEKVDDASMTAVPTGAVIVTPANMPHHVWAKDGDVTYQEAGNGPTAMVPVAAPAK
jgi:quercetin dioxygenase-like cupin family protein